MAMRQRSAVFGEYWLVDPEARPAGGRREFDAWHERARAEERGLKIATIMLEVCGRERYFTLEIPIDQEEPSHAQVTRLYESLPEVEDTESEEAMATGIFEGKEAP